VKKWIFGLITGFFLAFILIALAGLYGFLHSDRAVRIKDNSTLVLDLSGDVPEQIAVDIPGQLLGERAPITMVSLIRGIERAKTDSRITGIILRPSRVGIGWGKLQQLRRSLADFRTSGKKITSLLTVANTRDYYLASVADRLYLSPGGVLDVKGVRAEVMFFKDALAKIGVQADLEQIGAYKNFADVFKDNKMSDAFREATTSMMDDLYGGFLSTVAEARKKPLDEMRRTIEQTGPFEPERAQMAGMVDDLKYSDEVDEEVAGGKSKEDAPQVDAEDYLPSTAPTRLDSAPRIAVVYAVGDIMPGKEGPNPVMGGKTMGADTMADVVDEVEKDEDIKGVIVRIDSPGGDAFASDEIWRSMGKLSKKKPLVYSMSDTAASGGYYMAMTGDPIIAEPGTLTGSIGIVYGKFNLKGLYEKFGINVEVISRGDYARLDSVTDSYTPQERARVRELMQDFYKKFLAKVAASRKMTPEQVDALAQGRVWTGNQAKANGLVDELGGMEKALEMIKKESGISAADQVVLVEYPKRKRLWDILLERTRSSAKLFSSPLNAARAQIAEIEAFARTAGWARMPVDINIK
jgi:protease IV